MEGFYQRIRKRDDEIIDDCFSTSPLNSIRVNPEYLSAKDTKQLRMVIKIIGEMLIEKHEYRYVGEERGFFVRYIDGVYANDVFQNISYIIGCYYEIIGMDPIEQNIREVREWVERNGKIDNDFEQNHDYINFRNGLLKVRSDHSSDPCWQLYKHNPNFHTMVQIPHDFVQLGETITPQEACPQFHEFLTKISEQNADMYKTLWEIYGYCMQLSVRFKKAFLLVSKESNTGKSTYINILAGILGDENCSKVRLDKITSKGFGAAPAASKLLNYYEDLPRYIPVENIDIWKSQIDGFYFDFEKKYHDATKQRNILKQIYAANGLPKMSWDLTITVRLVILFFNYIFKPKSEGGDQIKFWEEKHILNNPEEIKGIIFFSIKALKDLFERDEFIEMSAEKVLEIALSETDIVYKFIKECCVKGYSKIPENRDGTIEDWFYQECTNLYSYFLRYQEVIGDNSKITRIIFTKILRTMGFPVKKVAYYTVVNGVKQRYFRNVYLGVMFGYYPDHLMKLVDYVSDMDKIGEEIFDLEESDGTEETETFKYL